MNPDLIILGRDPEDPSRWLLECPVCGDVRSVAYSTGLGAKWRGRSLCRCCALMARHRPLPDNTGEWICLGRDPDDAKYVAVRCPDCSQVRSARLADIIQRDSTLCHNCAMRRRATFIEDIPDRLIVLKQFATSGRDARALVQCPLCGLIFTKVRPDIVRSQYTFCQSCAHPSGERHHRWQGGHRHYYGPDWHDVRHHILERDDYMCQFPGCITSIDLHIHHVMPYQQSRDSSERNLITLCPAHHCWADQCLDESIPMFDAIISAVYDGI